MTVLVIAVTHRTAPLALLERVALDAVGARRLARAARGRHVAEALVLATCNRVEVYAEVDGFHGGLADLGEALATTTGIPLEELAPHLSVHYADRAVAHLFRVACGLDSMAVGEGQVLGQLRRAWRDAQHAGEVGRVLDRLVQRALRVGKRAHAETGLDAAGAGLVDAGLRRAERWLGPLGDQHALVVGAGSMSALVVSTVARVGIGSISVANRTTSAAERVASTVGGRVVPWAELDDALADADLVLTCTGAVGHVVRFEAARAATQRRTSGAAPQQAGRVRQHYVDLALPRDVDERVADLDGVRLVDLDVLGRDLAATGAGAGVGAEVERVQELVAVEVADYLSAIRARVVAPTVVALRARASEVVERELDRLSGRLPDLDPAALAEVRRTVTRVAEKLLHAPTARVKELAGREDVDGDTYAAALRELFDLDPDIAQVTTVAEVPLDPVSVQRATMMSALSPGASELAETWRAAQ
ncbi:MAG: glutamyl-tRNA reductase [Angustibacter sp.]